MRIKVITSDPVVHTKGLLRMLKHLDDREMSLSDLRILSATLLEQRFTTEGVTVKELAKYTGLTVKEVERLIPALVETRHLSEKVPLFGEIRYRLGQTGQSFADAVRREYERGIDEELHFRKDKKGK
ncbi:hypothetical protein vBCbaSRXM_85 [Citromicrobium phage vB_CbaS-RXM]|nr:hypothetical protein vBCbaSRXM_85 [Citromicrobium phage vB_CbaS-RXM]